MGVTDTHDDNQIPASDCGSAFNFTPVYIAPFGDHFGRLCPCAMSHIVSTDQIPSDTVGSHRCSCPGTNLISETGDPITVISLFGVRGEPASHRDASRYDTCNAQCAVGVGYGEL